MKNMILNLSNHQVQDILEELGMIDDNGNCPYTAEEIFKSALEYSASYYAKTNKQEWSEEDEERIKNIISVLGVQVCWDGATGKKMNPYQKEIDWLKSLKKRL